MATRTPEAITAKARSEQLAQSGAKPADIPGMERKRELLTATLAAAAAAVPRSQTSTAVTDRYEGEEIVLRTGQVRKYEFNPRKQRNPRHDEIKESIRTIGLTSRFSVTKRPGNDYYIGFAGAGTRIDILHELAREMPDDSRWAFIKASYVPWPGEAAVLAAHMAENEQRADISYFEKAAALWDLKEKLEHESGTPLSAQTLSAETKRLGTEVSLTVVKNYLFTIEMLKPIGDWLTAFMVSDTLRPTITSYFALATTLGVTQRELHNDIADCIEMTGNTLRTQASEQLIPTEVRLDTDALLADIEQAVATKLGVDARQLRMMMSAKAHNPRISAAELRTQTAPTARRVTASRTVTASATPATEGEEAPQTAPQHAMAQVPLRPPMLAPVGALAGGPATTPSAKPATARQEPKAELGTAQQAEVTQRPALPAGQDASERILDILQHIVTLADLTDCASVYEAMPLGYWMEMPAGSIDADDSAASEALQLRRAAWHVLASLSGQFHPEIAARLPLDADWRRSLAQKAGWAREFEAATLGVYRGGDAFLMSNDLYLVMWHPQIGPWVTQLMDLAAQWRQAEPTRFMVGSVAQSPART